MFAFEISYFLDSGQGGSPYNNQYNIILEECDVEHIHVSEKLLPCHVSIVTI